MAATIRFYIINLGRSKERLASITSHMKSLGIPFTRIAAVDGRQLTDEQADSYPLRYFRPLTKGELGCALSHHKCWQQIVEDQVDYGVILEDDAHIDRKLSDFLATIKPNQQQDWDYLKLTQYFNTTPESFAADKPFNIKQLRRKSAIILNKIDNFYLIKFHPPAIGTFGQIVTQQAAKHLAKNFIPTRPLDIDIKHLWDMYGLNILSLYPPVVTTSPHTSTLHDKLLVPRHPFKKLWFQLSFSCRLFYYHYAELGLIKAILLRLGKNVDLAS